MLAQLGDAVLRDLHAPLELERKRLGHHGHGQDAELLGELRDNRRGPCAGSTAHAGGDEHHVRTLEEIDDSVAILECRLSADIGIGAGTEALGHIAPELQRGAHGGLVERLRVGIRTHEFDAFDIRAQHVLDGVAATATNTDDTYDSAALTICIYQFKHCFPSDIEVSYTFKNFPGTNSSCVPTQL